VRNAQPSRIIQNRRARATHHARECALAARPAERHRAEGSPLVQLLPPVVDQRGGADDQNRRAGAGVARLEARVRGNQRAGGAPATPLLGDGRVDDAGQARERRVRRVAGGVAALAEDRGDDGDRLRHGGWAVGGWRWPRAGFGAEMAAATK
jgi:hypothetical protein